MIIRNPDRDRYVILSKESVEDVRLSWGARGLHAYLLSKPDGWEVMVVHLVKQSPKGRVVVEGLLDELEKFGYIVRSKPRRNQSGRFDGPETTIYERAQPTVVENRQRPSSPSSKTRGGKPASGKPASGKPTTSKEMNSVNTEPLLAEAIAGACGFEHESMTATARTTLAKAAGELAAAGATPEAVSSRATEFRRRWPQATLTPPTLVKHWPGLMPAESSASRDVEGECRRLGEQHAERDRNWVEDLLEERGLDETQRRWALEAWEMAQ